MIQLVNFTQKNDSIFEIVLKVNNREEKHQVELTNDPISLLKVEENFRPILTANPGVPKKLISILEKTLNGGKVRLPQQLPETRREWKNVA